MRPVIALLSDFGTRDHYAGTMKGVMLGICPDVTLVDITHDVSPHDIVDGALELAAACRFFPAGTIFLAVVDPGVGSARRGIAAEAGDYRFVAPDNGVLTVVFRDFPPKRVVELTERRYARPTVSRTFEGRDRFAPAAAWLAKGIQLTALGRPVADYQRFEIPVPEVLEDGVRGVVMRVDRFGNIVTNIDRRTFETIARDEIRAGVGGRAPRASRSSRPTQRSRRAGSARCSAAPITSSWRPTARARRSVWGWDAAPSSKCVACDAHAASLFAARGSHLVALEIATCEPRTANCEPRLQYSLHIGPFLYRTSLMIDFDLADEQRLLEQSVREWGAREVAPRIRELDRQHRFDPAILPQMAKLGLLGCSVPPEYGGAGAWTTSASASSARSWSTSTRRSASIMSVHAGLNCLTLLSLGDRGSEAAVSRAAGAGAEDRDLRVDRAGGRAATCAASRPSR